MDIKQEILLGSEKNINSVNVDNYTKIELFNNQSRITEFTVNDVVNSTEQFDKEREDNQVYRIYGRIEWMSLLNGLKNGYSELVDFFNPQNTDSKNITNSFDFYLVAPHSGDTYYTISGTNHRRRSFFVLTEKENFEIYNAGFTNNVFGEQVYSFNFKADFDVSEYYDKLGFPLTELFLYAQYKVIGNEEMSRTRFTSAGNKFKSSLTTKDLHVGDDVENHQGTNIEDVIEYDESAYYQALVEEQTYYIRTRYLDGTYKWLEWKYNPFIPLRLRYLDGVVSTAPLPEIIASASTFTAQIQNSPSSKLSVGKPEKKSIDTTTRTINKWDEQSSSTFDWDGNSGILTFTIPAAFLYEISFQTQIRLSYDTDKYIAETYLEDSSGYAWVEIPNTRRKYQLNSPVQKTSFTKSYVTGDQIRMRVRLIPNPDERKVYRIPDYAKMIVSDGKYVWRDILPQGYIDPITNEGVDYPFFNGRRYLFETVVLDTPPNLTTDPDFDHPNTLAVFDEIEYYQDATTLETTPENQDDLDNIGKPCQ